jgi:hypothetical protein
MMATNPKLPDYPNIPARKSADQHGKVQMIRQSKFPWPLLGLIAGAALLIAIIAVLPKAPHVTKPPSAAEVPRQPTAAQIQFTGVQIAPAPVGDSLYLNAVLHNTGNTAITGVQVNAQFMGANGTVAGSTNGSVQAVFGGTSSEDLTQAPIKPSESRPVRIYFEHTPKGWNHQVPALTVTTVTGTTP